MPKIKRIVLTLAAAAALWGAGARWAAATNPATLVSAAAGPYPGTVQFTWTVNDNLVSGDKFYIQYSTNVATTVWSPGNAQVVVTTNTAIPSGTAVTQVIGALNAGRDGLGAVQTPAYTFRVWIEASGLLSPVSNTAAATPPTPVFVPVSTMAYAGGMLVLEYNLSAGGNPQPAVDAKGNVYLASPYYVGGYGYAVAARKYDAAGRLVWVRFLTSSAQYANNYARGVAVDEATQDVYIGGSFSTASGSDIFVAKYNASGDLIWFRERPGAVYNAYDGVSALAFDNAAKNLYAAGYAVYSSTSNRSTDIWLAKYDVYGNELWERTYNSTAPVSYPYDYGRSVALDPAGNVYVAGYVDNSPNSTDMWLGKYSPSGAMLWTSMYSGSGGDYGYGVTVDQSGNPYLCGSNYDSVQGPNAFLRKYDGSGNALWTRSYDNPYTTYSKYETFYGCAVDKFGVVHAAGYEYRQDLGQGYNALYARYTSDGQLVSTFTYAAAGSDMFYGVAVSSAGAPFLDGFFSGQNSFGYYAPQAAPSSSWQLKAYSGEYTASVNLNWQYPAAVTAGTQIHIQIATAAAYAWNYAAAQINFSTIAVPASVSDSFVVRNLPASQDGAGNSTTPTLYFMAWVGSTPMGAPVSAQPRTPVISDRIGLYPQGRLTYAEAYPMSYATAMDVAGNVFQAFALSSGVNMQGGWALRAYDPRSARFLSTRFYNLSVPSVNASPWFDIKALAISERGVAYVAGSVYADPVNSQDIYLAAIHPDGHMLWEKVIPGLSMGIDQANALALDGSSNIYLGGQMKTSGSDMAAVLKKFSPSTGYELWSSTIDAASGSIGNRFNSLAVTTAAVYAAGVKGVTSTEDDIWLVKLSTATGAVLSQTAVSSPAYSGAYGVAAGPASDVYVAGRLNTGQDEAWLGKFVDHAGGALQPVVASTYTSPLNMMQAYNGVAYYGGYVYAAGYDFRSCLAGTYCSYDDIRVAKYDTNTLGQVWVKSFDAGSGANEMSKDVMPYGSGVFAGVSVDGRPGVYYFSAPSVVIGGKTGLYPGTVDLFWTAPADLSVGSSYYIQAALSPAALTDNYLDSQTVLYTTVPVLSGMYQSVTAGGLDASRDGSGAVTSPAYYFRAWSYDGSAAVPLSGTATAYANTPDVQTTAVTYPDSKVWSLTNAYGWRNKSAVDPAGYLYVVSNYWANNAAGAGSGIFVLRKYRPDMTTEWTKFFAGRPGEYLDAYAVTLDKAGDIIVAGSRGAWDSSTRYDLLALKYSPSGELLWSRSYDYDHNYDYGYAAAADDAGNIYLGGSAQNNSGSAAYIAKLSPAGAKLAELLLSGDGGAWGHEIVDLVYDSTNSVLYAAGNFYNAVTGGDAEVVRVPSSLDPALVTSTAVMTGDGNYWDQAGGIAADIAADGGGAVYAAASVYGGMETGSDIWLRKLSLPSLAEVWTRVYNDPGNSYDSAGRASVDSQGSVYVTGSESRWDINQAEDLFLRKFSSGGDVIWTRSFNSGGSSYERGWDVHVDSVGYVSVTGEMNGGFGVYRYRQLIFSANNPMLSVYVTSGTAGAPAGGVPIVIMPFDQNGGVNPELMIIGSASASGYYGARLPAGFQYFVGISTPGYKPTMKDQLMDPYGSFMVSLTGDATRQYRLYSKTSYEPGYTLKVDVSSGLVSGDYLVGEVFYSKNGDKAAYGIARSTSFVSELLIHNLPPAAGGVYGVNVNVPGKNKGVTLYLPAAFPETRAYAVDMTSAVAAVGFAAGDSVEPPSFQAVVRSTWGAPLDGVRVELSQSANIPASCGGYDPCWQKTAIYENLTDVNGRAVFNAVPLSTAAYNLEIRKQGYGNYSMSAYPNADCTMPGAYGVCITTTAYTLSGDFMLTLATYTLTGVVKYNGVPLPNAAIMVNGDYQWATGGDSYANTGVGGIRNDAKAVTGADGTFSISGLTDGNARLTASFMGNWQDLNSGNNTDVSDDLRITISSSGARGPSLPAGNPCLPGRTWVLDYQGECLGADNLLFNLSAPGANSLGTLYGSLTFVTTYTVSAQSPLEIPASSPVVVMAMQNCDGDCQARQLGFASLSGTLTSNTTSYAVTLSSGAAYWVKIYGPDWGMLSSFNNNADFSSTDTVRMDFTLTRAGRLRGQVKLPDGSNFRPDCSGGACLYGADIELRGQSVQFSDGTGLDEYGAFEFPNVPAGTYDVYLKPRGSEFRWPPAELDGVSVSVGNTAEVKLKLQDGLVVQPQIFGLPALSTPTWNYTVLGVPSGFQMNQRNITEMFFEEPQYFFNYSTATASWDKKYMVPGQYDFYLVVGVSYNPGGGDQYKPQSYYQFANFIGQQRGVPVKKSDTNPNFGTLDQPIPLNILGSVGQGSMTGRIKGGGIFSDADFEKIFSNFDTEIMPLIPAVMLYDTAGDLKGFGHALPDETAIVGFEDGIKQKSKTMVLDALAANPLRYLVWGLPPGRYTAVFVNPNYPPVPKEVVLPDDESYDFDFGAQTLVVGAISGVVVSSATGEAVDNAQVHLRHRTVEKFAVTDSSGAFAFGNLPPGIYRLEVSKEGFVKAGQKTGLAGNDSASFRFALVPTESRITGKVYLGKFPSPVTRQGVRLVAYDETMNVESPAAYLPTIEAQTAEDGSYELAGIVRGHLYKVSAFMEGKLPQTIEVAALNGDTVVDDIVLRDIPPQVTVKVRKSPDSASKVDVVITSPKALVTTPSCSYNPGDVFEATSAVSLALVPGANNTYTGQFTVSSSQRFYTVYVAAGDGDNRMEKTIPYDQTNDAKTEQYIQDAAIAGGEVMMDQETEEYSGIELDAGALTVSSNTADFQNLVGGFFSALPSVRTVKTAKGNVTLESAIKDLMASEVYNLDLSNAQPNKPFTLTLKYDKEKALNTGGLRICQYDEASGAWKEIPGNYTVDPMTGVVSVDVSSLELAYEGSGGGTTTPLARKRFRMSAVRDGRYVPSAAAPAAQTGKFAVFTAKPPTGTAAYSSAFEVYNLPNPFNLKAKTVNISSDGQTLLGASYQTPGTLIKYNLPAGKSGDLKFVIYNLVGEKVRTIDEGHRDGNQVYYSEWDGRNDNNQECASGVYFMLTYLDGKKLGRKAHKMAVIK